MLACLEQALCSCSVYVIGSRGVMFLVSDRVVMLSYLQVVADSVAEGVDLYSIALFAMTLFYLGL